MNETGIILLVSERSGSNLLRSLIGNHKEISAPIAPHFMHSFFNHRYLYLDLKKSENSKKLFEDMKGLANHPYHNWELKNTWDNKIVEEQHIDSFIKMMDYVYKQKAKQDNKKHYCSKGINSFEFIDQFRSELNQVKFIHMVRDPRDHVASWLKRPIALFTAYDAVIKWCSEQNVFLDAVKTKGLDALSIRYEDLIDDTEGTMTQILNYLNIPLDEACFQTDQEKNKKVNWNPYWKNLSNPVLSDNKEKYKSDLSDEEIYIVETIAKKEMDQFDYKAQTDQGWVAPTRFAHKLKKERKKKKKSVAKKKKEEMEKLQSKIQFIHEIRNKRREEWVKTGAYNESREKSYKKVLLDKKFKKCIETTAYYFLGYNTTKKISSLFRK